MKKITAVIIFCITASFLWAQNIPLKKVVILTSGLAYYEHSGSVNGAASISLPFRLDAVNDALKTLVLNDPATVNPSVTYQSENTLYQTLRSLMIDLSDDPGMAVILSRLRGAEVEIASPSVYKGRIASIEYRPSFNNNMMENEPWLLLSTQEGIRPYNLKEIGSIKFTNPVIEQDLNRALDLIAASRNSFSRLLSVNLPGTARRDVIISYVIPSPVWKVSYRLDLGASKPVFQGWAIVDNDSDTDWNNVSLSLVAGRPTSFIQNLYPPYYVSRPVLPLAIAGVAEAAVYDRAYIATEKAEAESVRMRMSEPQIMMDSSASYLYAAPEAASNLAAGNIQTASGSEAGGQFEFTIKNPVSLDRRMSAMFPLVESSMEARKLLIYSGSGRYPRLGAELTNSSSMKLPAGPITVYDGGVYAGDALIEFWNEGEKRLISFGDDLSVTATSGTTSATAINTVNISGGIMNITRRLTYSKTYTFNNSSTVSKQLIVEHNKTSSTELVSPKADEQTASAYRFNVNLPAGRETTLTVNEQRPISERITLSPLRLENLISYSANQEIPANVRRALERAIELKRASDAAEAAVREIQTQRTTLISDQDRIRRNLEAAGNQTQQGQEYLRRLVALDNEIDAATVNLERANAFLKTTQENYTAYLNNLSL